MIMSNLIEKT